MGDAPRLDEAELEVIPVRSGICYAALGPVFLMFYRRAPELEDLKARIPFLDAYRERAGRGAFISVIDGANANSFPDHPTRLETKRQAEDYGPVIATGAVVLEGSGVRQSLIRSFLRGLLLFKRSPMPYRFFATVDEAADHVLSALELDPAGHPALLGAIEVLRSRAAEGMVGEPDDG